MGHSTKTNTMKSFLFTIILALLLASCTPPEPAASTSTKDPFPLKAYVETPGEAFRYEITETVRGESYTEYRIYLVSGTWLTEAEVDEPEWWHWLTMVVPDELQESESLMWIGGGWRGDSIPIAATEEMISAAISTGSVISHISNIPFQPIDYTDDTLEGVFEDDLIAYGWLQFLEGGASEDLQPWLARFPMTRSSTAATVQVVQPRLEAPATKNSSTAS